MSREQRIADGAMDVIASWGVEEWERIADALDEATVIAEIARNHHEDNAAAGSPAHEQALADVAALSELAEEIRMEVLCDD